MTTAPFHKNLRLRSTFHSDTGFLSMKKLRARRVTFQHKSEIPSFPASIGRINLQVSMKTFWDKINFLRDHSCIIDFWRLTIHSPIVSQRIKTDND